MKTGKRLPNAIAGITGAAVLGYLGASIALLPGHAQSAPSPRRVTTLAYAPAGDRGMPLVQARINNGSRLEKVATFVMDTGFTQCLMTDRLARALQLCGEPALREDGTPACFADGRPLQQVTPSRLQVGGFRTDQCNFVLLKAYRLDLLDCPLDGVLGWQFLAEHAVLFDFQAHRITLWQGGELSEAELRAADMQDAVMLPRANKTPGSFDIAVRLDDRCDAHLAVDTGGAHTLLSPGDARRLELLPTRLNFKQPTIFGDLKANEARLSSLTFGGQRVTDLSIRYLQQEHPNLPPHLGMDVLGNYRMLIDYPAGKLYLKPIATSDLRKK